MLNFEIADDAAYAALEIPRLDDPIHGTGLAGLADQRSRGRVPPRVSFGLARPTAREGPQDASAAATRCRTKSDLTQTTARTRISRSAVWLGPVAGQLSRAIGAWITTTSVSDGAIIPSEDTPASRRERMNGSTS
jgi:hypothetical protein